MEEAGVGLEDKFVYKRVNPSLHAVLPASSTCVQNITTSSVNMALEQNQQAVWRVTGFCSGTINMHELTGNITDCEM